MKKKEIDLATYVSYQVQPVMELALGLDGGLHQHLSNAEHNDVKIFVRFRDFNIQFLLDLFNGLGVRVSLRIKFGLALKDRLASAFLCLFDQVDAFFCSLGGWFFHLALKGYSEFLVTTE